MGKEDDSRAWLRPLSRQQEQHSKQQKGQRVTTLRKPPHEVTHGKQHHTRWARQKLVLQQGFGGIGVLHKQPSAILSLGAAGLVTRRAPAAAILSNSTNLHLPQHS